jgi:hypothetical protein
MGGLPRFRVGPEDEVPGFRVTPQDVVPGFNLDANGVPRPEPNWSAGMRLGSTPQDALFQQPPASQMVPSPTSESGTFLRSSPSVWPDWLNRLLTMPLPKVSSAFDPRTGRRIVPYAPLINRASFNPMEDQDVPEGEDADVDVDVPETTFQDSEQVQTKPTDEPPPSDAPGDIITPMSAASPPRVTVSPSSSQTIWNPWFPPSGSESFLQASSRLWLPQSTHQATPFPPVRAATSAEGSNLALPIVKGAWQRWSPPQSQPRQQNFMPIAQEARPTSWPTLLQTPAMTMGAFEPRRGREPAHLYPQNGDVETLPHGSIISSDYPYRQVGTSSITHFDAPGTVWSSDQGTADPTGWMGRWDFNIHRVGDGDTPSDLSRYERHQVGVHHSIGIHVSRGFELVTDKEVDVDVPGFQSPRRYDYIIRDPVTDLYYGVEVKTTIGDTIRLQPSQVAKDAIVATQGGTVRDMGLKLHGVSYMTYCFECERLDVRSAALREMLRSAGVQVKQGSLPGDIRR